MNYHFEVTIQLKWTITFYGILQRFILQYLEYMNYVSMTFFFFMHVSLQSLIKNAHEIRNWQTIQSIPNVQNHLPSYFYFLVWKAASLRYTSQYKEKTITILFHADFN